MCFVLHVLGAGQAVLRMQLLLRVQVCLLYTWCGLHFGCSFGTTPCVLDLHALPVPHWPRPVSRCIRAPPDCRLPSPAPQYGSAKDVVNIAGQLFGTALQRGKPVGGLDSSNCIVTCPSMHPNAHTFPASACRHGGIQCGARRPPDRPLVRALPAEHAVHGCVCPSLGCKQCRRQPVV